MSRKATLVSLTLAALVAIVTTVLAEVSANRSYPIPDRRDQTTMRRYNERIVEVIKAIDTDVAATLDLTDAAYTSTTVTYTAYADIKMVTDAAGATNTLASNGVIDGEHILDDSIDDDSLDFTDITGADFTLTDCGAIEGTTITGTTVTVGGNITLEQDAYIENSVLAAIALTFPSASAVSNLGQVIIVSTDTNIADEYVADIAGLNAMHDAGTNVAYASLRVTIDDASNGTEDASVTTWVKVNGTNIAQEVVDSTGISTPGEATVDGKYAIVGGDASTGLMLQKAAITSSGATIQTNSFAVAFGAAPIVVCTYTEDPGSAEAPYVQSVTATNFECVVVADKNFGYIAVGTRP